MDCGKYVMDCKGHTYSREHVRIDEELDTMFMGFSNIKGPRLTVGVIIDGVDFVVVKREPEIKSLGSGS